MVMASAHQQDGDTVVFPDVSQRDLERCVVRRQVQFARQIFYCRIAGRDGEAMDVERFGKRRVFLDSQQRRGNPPGAGFIHLRQRRQRPLRVETGRNRVGESGQILAVDEPDLAHVQPAFIGHGFNHAGACKTSIGLAGKNGFHHPVMGQSQEKQLRCHREAAGRHR